MALSWKSNRIRSVFVYIGKFLNVMNSPVLTSLNVTLFCVLSASFKLGCTKSFSAPPLDEAAILVVALGLNPRHAKIRRFGLVGSGMGKER